MEIAKAGLTDEYCEFNRMEAVVRQPVNAWSNLCYVFFGSWIGIWSFFDFRNQAAINPIRRFPLMSLWIGLMLLGLGFGSFFFHASLTKIGQHFDMGFTYGLTLSLGVSAAYRLSIDSPKKENRARKLIFGSIAVVLFLLMTFLKWRVSGKLALPIFMLSGIGLATGVYFRFRGRFSGKMLLSAVFATILAGIFRSLDLEKIGCASEGIYQSHAVWHFATALAAFLFLSTLRQENSDLKDILD